MIKVGINENVIIEKVEVADAKGTLLFNLKTLDEDEAEGDLDPMAALGADGYTDTGGNSLQLRFFPPLPPFDKTPDGTAISAVDQQKQAANSLADKKNVLFQILNTFMTSDKIKFDLYRNTGIDQKNFGAKIVQEDVINKIFHNMATDFVALFKPFMDKKDMPLRFLLVRQSKTKHFADFRQKFVKEYPFIEPMTVDAAASKLEFTKYELKNKLNDDTVLDKSAADIAEDAGVSLDAKNVFGGDE